MSIAFLSLLEALCGAGGGGGAGAGGGYTPRALGAGSRAPGLEPYLQHAERLARAAPHRAYSDPTEKWQVRIYVFFVTKGPSCPCISGLPLLLQLLKLFVQLMSY